MLVRVLHDRLDLVADALLGLDHAAAVDTVVSGRLLAVPSLAPDARVTLMAQRAGARILAVVTVLARVLLRLGVVVVTPLPTRLAAPHAVTLDRLNPLGRVIKLTNAIVGVAVVVADATNAKVWAQVTVPALVVAAVVVTAFPSVRHRARRLAHLVVEWADLGDLLALSMQRVPTQSVSVVVATPVPDAVLVGAKHLRHDLGRVLVIPAVTDVVATVGTLEQVRADALALGLGRGLGCHTDHSGMRWLGDGWEVDVEL